MEKLDHGTATVLNFYHNGDRLSRFPLLYISDRLLSFFATRDAIALIHSPLLYKSDRPSHSPLLCMSDRLTHFPLRYISDRPTPHSP